MKVLLNHNSEMQIGRLNNHNGLLFFEFTAVSKITLKMLQASLPGCAFEVLAWHGNGNYLSVVRVASISILPQEEHNGK